MTVSDVLRRIDLTGVFGNALLGGVTARSARLDPVGFAILAIPAGLGGRLIRDVLPQHGTPTALAERPRSRGPRRRDSLRGQAVVDRHDSDRLIALDHVRGERSTSCSVTFHAQSG